MDVTPSALSKFPLFDCNPRGLPYSFLSLIGAIPALQRRPSATSPAPLSTLVMAALDALEIFLVTIAGVVAIFSIVICCSAACLACCGGAFTPLFCWAGWILACCNPWGGRPSSYHAMGGHGGGTFTTVTIIPPPPNVVISSDLPQASAPPAMAVAEAMPWQQQHHHHHLKQLNETFSSGVVSGITLEGSAPPAVPPSSSLPSISYQYSTSTTSNMTTINVPPPPQTTAPRDLWALLLFVLHMCFLIALAIRLGLPSLGVWEHALVDTSSHTIPTNYSTQIITTTTHLLYLSVLLALLADLIALAWLYFMLQWSSLLIHSTIYTTVLVSSLLSFLSLLLGRPIGFLLFALLALTGLCLLYEEQSRIFLSSANLGTACRALLEHRKLFGVACLFLFLQFLFALIWSVAALGVYASIAAAAENGKHQQHQTAGQHTLLCLFLVLSLYWGSEVCQNVLKCTVVGTIASWWYFPDVSFEPVAPALARAAGPSLGSICVGSFFVGGIESFRALLRGMGGGRGGGTLCCCCRGICGCGLLGCLIDYALSCVEAMWRTFNRFTFVFVGVWGYGYREGGRLAMKLFEAKGWDLVLNDYLIGNVLFLGSVMVGGIVGFVGVGFTRMFPYFFVGLPLPSLFIGVVGFVIGVGNCLVLVSVLSSAVDTVFVCYAADPGVLQVNRPVEFACLEAAWEGGRMGEQTRLNAVQVMI